MLEKKIAADNAEKGLPAPNFKPNRKINGQFHLEKDVQKLREEISETGEHVIVDTRALNEQDLADLKAAVQDPDSGIDPKMITFWP